MRLLAVGGGGQLDAHRAGGAGMGLGLAQQQAADALALRGLGHRQRGDTAGEGAQRQVVAQVAADQVFRKSILNSSPEEITFLKRVLLTSGKDGQQAFKELQGATVRHLRDEATKGMGMDSMDRPLVSPAKLHQTVQALDANGRLDVLLGKKNAQTVRDLNDVARYISTVPPGTLVNPSGTAGTIMAAIAEAGASGALTGLPVPVVSGIRQIIKMRQEGRTKAKINEALNALPPVTP